MCSARPAQYADPGVCPRVAVAPGVQGDGEQGVFHQDGHRSQDEGGEQVHVDVVPHAVEPPGAEGSQRVLAFDSHMMDSLLPMQQHDHHCLSRLSIPFCPSFHTVHF